jgi:hypothetical protein
MTAVDLTGLFYTKRCEKISLVAAANGAATIIGNSRQNLGNLGYWGGGGGWVVAVGGIADTDRSGPVVL